MTAHANSAKWSLVKKRSSHFELTDLTKPDYAREMAVKAAWVTEWRAALEGGDAKRLRELEGLMGTSPISELGKKR